MTRRLRPLRQRRSVGTATRGGLSRTVLCAPNMSISFGPTAGVSWQSLVSPVAASSTHTRSGASDTRLNGAAEAVAAPSASTTASPAVRFSMTRNIP